MVFRQKKSREETPPLSNTLPKRRRPLDNATNLFSRTFKVDPYVFANAARNVPGLDTNDVSAIARSLFGKLGVDWESPKGKAVFYNDRLGLLFVRATLSDLDTVEHAVQALI